VSRRKIQVIASDARPVSRVARGQVLPMNELAPMNRHTRARKDEVYDYVRDNFPYRSPEKKSGPERRSADGQTLGWANMLVDLIELHGVAVARDALRRVDAYLASDDDSSLYSDDEEEDEAGIGVTEATTLGVLREAE
jgi:hypothetical protein